MPTIAPSYLYTFVAVLAVGSLLVFSFLAYAGALRVSAETRQLKNLMNAVAAKGTELVTLASYTNVSGVAYLQMPAMVGSRQYWFEFHNDSSKAWLEAGLGNIPFEETELRIYIPRQTSATGFYISGYGAAFLNCSLVGVVPVLWLSNSSAGG